MREIKFRAWDKNKEIMSETFDLDDLIYGYDSGCKINDEKLYVGSLPKWENIVLMQYTELIDKDGKEIYEGDIVKHKKGNLIVEWCNQEVGFRLYNGIIYRQTPEPNISEWDIEIIGNIYENPELWGEKNE